MEKPSAHIWHEGNLIKVGHYAGPGLAPAPLEENISAFLTEHMEYNHVVFLRGREKIRSDRPVRVERKQLWRPDPGDGLLTCQAGYLDWIIEKLGNLGFDVKYKRIMPRRPRPGWNEVDMDAALARYTFRPGQAACFDAMVGRILSELGGVIDATVGFGKTDLIAPLGLAFPNARIVVGVRGLDNVQKTYANLRLYLPSVGRVTGQIEEFGHRITVYSMDSFEKFDGDADIAVFDEAHEIVAKKYARPLAERLDRVVAIAMTATADSRSDGADARMEAIFGPTIYYLPYAEAERLGLVVPIRVVVHAVPMHANPVAGMQDDTARKRNGIWRNKTRNRAIANAVNAMGEGTQVLILVATVEHLVHLRRYLPHFEAVWAESSNKKAQALAAQGLWPDFEKMTPMRRVRLYEDFRAGKIRKAIATIWAQGVSFDGLQVLFWAKAGASAIAATQGPGRVSRIDAATGKAYGEVHDLNDEFDSSLNNQFLRRIRLYRTNGWTIVHEEEPVA
jgi:superfamily II DNA or RNA helicase